MKFLGVDFDYYFENYPNKEGCFGKYGGYLEGINKEALEKLAEAYPKMLKSEAFTTQYERTKGGRMGKSSPLVLLSNLSNENVKIYGKLKRESSFDVTPCVGQVFLADYLNKDKIIASADDGVAAVMATRVIRVPCEVYINPKVSGDFFIMKIKVMGGIVVETDGDPEEEVIKAFNKDPENTFLYRRSAASPHPYPTIIRDFSKYVGDEAYKQFKEVENDLPTAVITYAGNGEGSVGFISSFTNISTDIVAVNPECDIPELMFLNDLERIRFAETSKCEAEEALNKLMTFENIQTDINGAHALAYALKYAKNLEKGTIIVNL